MGSGIAGIDHVVLGVRALEEACGRWRRLGFTLSPRGRHVGQDTANYCVMFAADYVELLGRAEEAAPVFLPQAAANGLGLPRLDTFLKAREGLMAAALAPAGGAESARAQLLRRGLHPSEPRPLGRDVELAEGAVTPRFSLVALPPEETPGLDCFLCEQLTPELLRRPEWLIHPNGAVGLGGIHVLVDSTAALPTAYDRLFGMHQVTTTDAVVSVHTGRHRIVFSAPDDFATMHPALEGIGELPPPAIAALELVVGKATDTAEFLARQEVAFTAMPDGSLALPAAAANGAILFFAEG
jgi:catechol 2,3-dioxygenase-like lactoylglutathione lyase family enzyme